MEKSIRLYAKLTVLGRSVLGGPLDTGNNLTVVALTAGVENLDGDQVGLLGHTVLGAAGGAGDVGAVAVAVLVEAIAGKVGTPDSAAAEIAVVGVDTGINDVRVSVFAGRGVVDVVGGSGLAVRDAA